MPKPLDRATLRELIDLLTPLCSTPTQRRALFTMALGFHPVLNGLNYEDDTMTFLPNAIAQLHAYGEFEDGKTALWLVLEEVRQRVGRDGERRIDALEAAVNGGVQPLPNPQVATPSAPPATNHERQIAALLKQLEAAEAKEAWDIVIELGEKILSLDEWNETVREKTAEAYYNRCIVEDKPLNEPNNAISDLNRAIELNQIFAGCYVIRAISFYFIDDFDRAISDCNRAIQLDSAMTNAYVWRGIIHDAKNEYDNAIVNFERTIKLNPKSASLFQLRGDSYSSNGQYKLAISDYNRAIRLEPKNPEYYRKRGVCYRDMKLFSEALVDLNKAVELDKSLAIAYVSRGKLYKLMNSTLAAKIDFQRAAEMGDEDAQEELKNL
jgi:tetratricopeptide (TPR) repeat protein